jgi:hypothetical protein
MQNFRKLITRLLVLHFVLLAIHGIAHVYHGVYPDPVGWFIVVFAYYVLPAIGLFRFSWRSIGSFLPALLGVAAAFVHGLIYHFVLDTPDYVCYFGAHITGRWFALTAFGLAAVDGAIVIATVAGLLRPVRNY